MALHVEGGETTSAEAAPKIETAVDESKLDTATAAKSEPVGASATAAEPIAVVETAPIQVRLWLSLCTPGPDVALTLQRCFNLNSSKPPRPPRRRPRRPLPFPSSRRRPEGTSPSRSIRLLLSPDYILISTPSPLPRLSPRRCRRARARPWTWFYANNFLPILLPHP